VQPTWSSSLERTGALRRPCAKLGGGEQQPVRAVSGLESWCVSRAEAAELEEEECRSAGCWGVEEEWNIHAMYGGLQLGKRALNRDATRAAARLADHNEAPRRVLGMRAAGVAPWHRAPACGGLGGGGRRCRGYGSRVERTRGQEGEISVMAVASKNLPHAPGQSRPGSACAVLYSGVFAHMCMCVWL
jgi:hypothetical protein